LKLIWSTSNREGGLGSGKCGVVVLGWAVRGSFGQFWGGFGGSFEAVGADRKGRGGKDGIVLMLCGSSGVERAHNLSDGDSWRCGSRGAFDELWGGCYQGSGAPWYRRVRECAV
jgi:hypothetical protein